MLMNCTIHNLFKSKPEVGNTVLRLRVVTSTKGENKNQPFHNLELWVIADAWLCKNPSSCTFAPLMSHGGLAICC